MINNLSDFIKRHPRIGSWVFLGAGMVVILLWSAKDVGLLPGQLLALAVATVLVAGLCVWIIYWET